MKQRLDQAMVIRGLVASRSQAESYIKLGQVTVDGRAANKPGLMVAPEAIIKLLAEEQFVSRAALKLASVAAALGLDFGGRTVLDVGSSTGGFTQYALSRGAAKVIAVELGTEQLHPSLRGQAQIELHEKTDIRQFKTTAKIDLVVADVSFMSLREILPAVARLVSRSTAKEAAADVVVMVKPQFEAAADNLKHKGVIKNDKIRRTILKNFENWVLQHNWVIVGKADSQVAGAKGNQERFYHLRLAAGQPN